MKRRFLLALMLILAFAIPVSAQTGEKIVYGHSGEGRELVAWRYGTGEHVLVMCFAIHGFEDNWDQDGRALVFSAGKLQEYLEKSSLPRLHNWTVYVLPCLNPDGLYSGWTNNGPGRCTTTYFDSSGNLVSGKGIDMNRCFPTRFQRMTNSRNFNGSTPMACLEARALSDFIQRIKGQKTNVLMDVHGWLEQTITTSQRILDAVQAEFPANRISAYNGGNGYLISYAHAMGYEACLLELPEHFENYFQYTASDCTQRIIQCVAEIIKSEKTECSVNGHRFDMLEQAPTCTQDGFEKKKCRNCGLEESEIRPAPGHSIESESLVTVLEPTATHPGLERYNCRRCGQQDLTRRIPAVFGDVNPDAYYADPLDWAFEQGYLKGVTADAFCPDQALTRAMLVTVLYRYAGQPEGDTNTEFTDISPNAYYIPALNWAAANGIIHGMTPTEFAPDQKVTRQQAAVIFHRFVQLLDGDNGLRDHEPFADETQISEYAREAAHWSAANGIFMGDGAGKLNPQGCTTRAQCAALLMRLDRYLQMNSQEETIP